MILYIDIEDYSKSVRIFNWCHSQLIDWWPPDWFQQRIAGWLLVLWKIHHEDRYQIYVAAFSNGNPGWCPHSDSFNGPGPFLGGPIPWSCAKKKALWKKLTSFGGQAPRTWYFPRDFFCWEVLYFRMFAVNLCDIVCLDASTSGRGFEAMNKSPNHLYNSSVMLGNSWTRHNPKQHPEENIPPAGSE